MSSAAGTLCGGCGLFAILILSYSFASIAPTEMALKYNYLTKTVSTVILDSPGIIFTGPFNSVLKYPKTIQTIEYDQAHRALLDGRTFDGLPLMMGIAFQYRLMPERLYDLYHTFENDIGDYLGIFNLVGIHVITEEATKFTAYEFFNDKQKIASTMRAKLDEYFQAHLFATVESLQINEDDLPPAFTETILSAATSKQNITQMEKTLNAKVVEFATARLVATAQANVTIQQALGDRHRILQNGQADASIIEAYVQAQTIAYGGIRDDLGLEGSDLLKYIWYDTLGGGGVASDANEERNVEMLFGINPAAYITEK